MAKQKLAEEPEVKPEEKFILPDPVEENVGTMRDLFHRKVVGGGNIRQLTMRRTLTRPLVSMAKRKSLAVECTSDMTTMDLPLKGRAGGLAPTRVFEAKELIPTEHGFVDGDEVLVLCHEIMCSAIERAGYKSLKPNPDAEALPEYVQTEGRSLVGALLGFLSGDIEDGKRYRAISIAELE